jgi:hypothetical protein
VSGVPTLSGERTGWEHVPHGADIGVRGWGTDVAAAFEQAALATTAIAVDPSLIRLEAPVDITCEAASLEDLLVEWLNALIFPDVGTQTARDLADGFGTLDTVLSADEDEVRSVAGVGPVVARHIAQFFKPRTTRKVIDRCFEHGLEIAGAARPQKGPFAGKTVVFTGSLAKTTRSEAEKWVRRLGGRTATSVSHRTDLMVVGEEPGSKYGEGARARDSNCDGGGFPEARAGLIVGRDAVVAAIKFRWGPLLARHIDFLAPTTGRGECVRVTRKQIGFDHSELSHELQLISRLVVWKEYASNASRGSPQCCFVSFGHGHRLQQRSCQVVRDWRIWFEARALSQLPRPAWLTWRNPVPPA